MKKYTIPVFFHDKYFIDAEKSHYLLTVFLSLCLTTFLFTTKVIGQTTITFTTPGTSSWTCPAGVTSVNVACWGGGGKGGRVNTNGTAGAGGGGGGGAYSAQSGYTVVPGSSYTVVVGTGSTSTAAGGDSYFINNTTVMAKGGNSVADNTPGGATGGQAIASVGTTKYSGGNGATGVVGNYGGGGGSSAGTGANGNNGNTSNGGAAPTGGGAGGNGQTGNGTGYLGSDPGGAGGGAKKGNGGANNDGGAGANGKVTISYTCPTYSLTSVSAVSPVSACDAASLVTLNSSAAGLPVGTYTITYSRSLPNATGLTASMTVSSAGIGTFTATGLTTAGTCTITVSNLSSGSGTPCSSAISSNNTVNITISAGGLSGSKTIGPSGDNYNSIAAAVAAMNSCGIAGPISLVLQSDYLSTVETFPITIPFITGVSLTNTITIYPAVSGLKITSNGANGTLFLNGADYITIDGRVNATGTTRDLTIENTNTSGYSVYLNNGATNNTIKYCNIKGQNTTSGEGVVWLGSGTTGNSNNTIDNCDIGPDGTTTPLVLIYSNASGGAINSSNTVSNCLLHDYFVSGGSASGINCNINNTAWTITGNSLYQTASRTTTAATGYDGISIFSGDGYTINNNSIGGSSASCGGSALTITGGYNNTFYGIYFDDGLSTTNTCSLQGNVINNISFQTRPNSSGNMHFVGMHIRGGKVNIGNTTGNTIGNSGTTGGITINISNATAGTFYNSGIEYYAVSGLVQNNNIGSITINGTAAGSGAINFDGIFSVNASQNAAITISGNTIGSSSTSASIQTMGSASVPVIFRGISFAPAGTGDITASGNTIANLVNNSTATTAYIRGIECFGSTRTGTISGNTIRDLTTASASIYSDGSAAISGIVVTNSSGNSHLVTQNSIYKLLSTHTTAAVSINGIITSTASTLERNLIYSLVLASNSTTNSSIVSALNISPVSGLTVCNVKNNMIRLGLDANGNSINLGTRFIGIWDYWGDNFIFNNSIYIGGQPSSTTPIPVACIYNDNNNSEIRNNILFNERTGPDDNNFALFMGSTYNAQACNYNCLYRPGGPGFSLVYRNSIRYNLLATWQSSGLGFDANSVSNEPGFINELSATPNMHLRPSSGTCYNNGTAIAAVTNDFDNDPRLSPPDIGADEYTIAGLVWNGDNSSAWNTSTNWTVNTIPKKADVILIPSGRPRYPVITTSYDAGSYHTTIESGASITVGPNAKLDITGTITNNAGIDGIVIQSTASGTGSLIHSTATVPGTIQRYITGSTNTHLRRYHCVSIPLDESNTSYSGLFYHSYLFYFDESINNWKGMGSPTDTELDEKKGYLIYFVFNNDTTYNFPGPMKAGNFDLTDSLKSHVTGPTDYSHGWNLVPNPYPSSIDWNAALGWTKTNIDNAIYIWKPGVDSASGTYASYVGGSSSNGGSRYIQVGQSFFIHANTTSPAFSMNNSVRVHQPTAFFKNANDTIADELKLLCSNELGITDELVVKFNADATADFDPDWDAYNLSGEGNVPDISSIIPGNIQLSINTMPYAEEDRVIPLRVNCTQSRQLTFTASGMENFTMTPPIYLHDIFLQKIINLSDEPVYVFDFEPGQEERFKLVFKNITHVDDPAYKDWLIYKCNDKINLIFPALENKWAKVSIYDLAGRNLFETSLLFKGIKMIDAPKQSGIYIVRVSSDSGSFSAKVFAN